MSWYENAAIYQIYPRSFADGNGDGIGDLAGVRAHLKYLADLGVDALWFNPWYPSSGADGGYDVIDYRDIDPEYGTLAEAEKLIAEAAELGLRTIVDIVPNHVSHLHPWFVDDRRELFWFRDRPNNWVSEFGGSPWTQVEDGSWYLHLFTAEQPDLNWTHPAVRQEHEDVLRFWFDRGAAGVRIDSAVLPVKDPALPDLLDGEPHPFVDRDELHDIYRSWRQVADSYDEPRILVGELWLPDAARFARYLRPDELHTAFNLDFLACPWDATRLRESIDRTLAAHAPVDAPATWVLSNHDVTRVVTRYGRKDTSFSFEAKKVGLATDLELGTRRARAAALLACALPGAVYVYQGEELGLPEYEVPADAIRDPMHVRSGGVDPGRDGCRIPLPWSGGGPPYGFGATPTWLPQPAGWENLTVEAQDGTPGSMLTLYREVLRARREFRGGLRWLDADGGVLAFTRDSGPGCVVNLSDAPVAFDGEVVLASGPLEDGLLPVDTAAYIRNDL
ncbi:alpha-amylase family glycosyl hydrolase [Cryptosporangium phraense]|uniref:Glycoside hydrolase family 13 protein n=1 Tax=Cryptosporangium phraense TaxID=2593070 RepID=A0A545AWE6_9ACTN|nr:alpha-amylase family glycosyl hydrolase [Cryptosporangium phraense]TQS45652.1 glycoside hydrolase family 13 protein [Cryptosporangium phraense]